MSNEDEARSPANPSGFRPTQAAALSSYLAEDRLLAIATRTTLGDRAQGAALFADVSGFTALTEALAQALGPSRGAEELSIHLNAVYEALIADVRRYGGSVVAFAGDAITCWFEGDDSSAALSCALAMQASMQQFANLRLASGQTRSLAVKAGIAQGTARRFLVGNPALQLLDILAGATLGEMSDATALAMKGEVILSPACLPLLGDRVKVREFRADGEGRSFAVVESFPGAAHPPPASPCPVLSEEAMRPFLLRPVYERLMAGQGQFLTELRPAVALFLKFGGIDYDRQEDAESMLDAYLRWVQGVVEAYGGFLLAVGMGDKGSHFYCCFGAPTAHENSAWRAISAASELRRPPPELDFIVSPQIGISSGRMRTGAYGSTLRRTYGVLGDAVNLAARLMEHAGPGEVLVSEETRKEVKEAFVWDARPPLKAKGKSEVILSYSLRSVTGFQTHGGFESQYALPMVGRQRELALCEEKLKTALTRQGQILSLCGEAGLGKSRLLSEVARLAGSLGFLSCVGQCQAHGKNTSYLPWREIWRFLLGLTPGQSLPEQIAQLESFLVQIDPMLCSRLPLLGAILNLPIPENDVTRPMETRLRKVALEGLLLDCLRHVAGKGPILLVLEDAHWIDSLSYELTELVARNLSGWPIALVWSSRPPEPGSPALADWRSQPNFTEILLEPFSAEESERLVQLKLAQLFDSDRPASPDLVRQLSVRSSGNPFYLEELMNYLRDTGQAFDDPGALEKLELPASLQTLILSRIDRLTETQKTVIKVASTIGRLFPAAVLWGLQMMLDRDLMAADLDTLCAADLTALDRPLPELLYIFKHIITQEVAYESLPHATRARLHEEIGLCLERLHRGSVDQQLDVLAFHFDRSENLPKKQEYLLKAASAAQGRYANAAAINYYERALPLLSGVEKVTTLLNVGKVWDLVGEWKKAGRCYQQAFETASELGDRQAQARCQAATGDLLRKQGLFSEALDWLNVARTGFRDIGDSAGVGQTLHAAGTVAAMQGNYETAWSLYQESLTIRRTLNDRAQIANLVNNLGLIARFKPDYPVARDLIEQGLEIRRGIGDRWAIANSLNNLGVLLRDMDDPAAARQSLEEALKLNRQVGDRWAVANVITSLGEVAVDLGDWETARAHLRESLRINLELGDRTAVAFILEGFAAAAAGQGEARQTFHLAGAATALREEVGSPLSPSEQGRLERVLKPARDAVAPGQAETWIQEGRQLNREVLLADLMK
jgi:predicted ATPase/class 3 adenylate cyclase